MRERPFEKTLKVLRDSGLRPTKQRMALAKLLFEKGHRHFKADDVHREAQSEGIDVSLATIYNTLNQFTEAGLLREIMVDSGCCYYDNNLSDHHHFYFEKSGKLEDVMEDNGIIVNNVPMPPNGGTVRRVDVILRVDA